MAETIPFDQILAAVRGAALQLQAQRQYFNDLDSEIGDSDHGDSIDFTFGKVIEKLDDYDFSHRDIGVLLQTIGKAIILAGGAAMGPLYGTGFVEAGKAVAGKTVVDPVEFVALWKGFVTGIEKRGGVKLGEKTMFDTVAPAVAVLSDAAAQGDSLHDAMKAMIVAAHDGMMSTKDMISKRGRSSRLGERSIGHIDPGSASMNIFISTFLTTLGA